MTTEKGKGPRVAAEFQLNLTVDKCKTLMNAATDLSSLPLRSLCESCRNWMKIVSLDPKAHHRVKSKRLEMWKSTKKGEWSSLPGSAYQQQRSHLGKDAGRELIC